MYKNHTNNQTDNIKFIELNARPQYNIPTKTAGLNCILFVTISLGMAFPFLYIIAVFAIGI
jgi:hypothetical protein